MKRRISIAIAFIAIACMAFSLAGCLSTLQSLAGDLSGPQAGAVRVTNAEAIAALKDALKAGIGQASGELSVTDAYFKNALLKILLPPEAKPIMDSIGKIPGGQKLIDDVVLRLNRTAEESAKEVMPIFVDAITSMTISDGIAIVKDGDGAATGYLRNKTYASLVGLYKPKVGRVLAEPLVLGISAQKSWDTLTLAYNKAGIIPNNAAALMGQSAPMPPVSVDLAGYATQKALDGLFIRIAAEESKIRANPAAYASAMIKKVFGALRDGLL